MPQQSFPYAVGIDFGSTYSGFAYASAADPSAVRGFVDWENQPPGAAFPKTPTSIRYEKVANPDGSTRFIPAFWGHKSRKLEQRRARNGDLLEIRLFKLWFDPAVPRTGLPDGMAWMQPIVDFLSFIALAALETMRHSFGHIDKADVLWCITVPAIWDDTAKRNLRKAAALAGIVDDANRDALCIILEPEAAALYTLKSVCEFSYSDKSTFMILDAGGGTVDLTTHTINAKGNNRNSDGSLFSLKERPSSIRKSTTGSIGDRSSISSESNTLSVQELPTLTETSRGTGELCGSAYVDMEFFRYFSDQIGAENKRQLETKRPELLIALTQEWERVKRDFKGMPPPGQPADPEVLQFPAGTLQFVPDDVKQRWSDEYGTEEELHIPMQDMINIFSRPVQQCLDLIADQLARVGGHCNYLVLVGGFSSSKYLYKRIQDRFASNFDRIIVPADPTAAVVRGAVMYGLDPTRIQQRCCRFSYGYISNVSITDIDTYSDKDIWRNESGEAYIKVFKCLVAENQHVIHTEEFSSSAYPMHATQTRVQVRLVATPSRLVPNTCYSYHLVDNVIDMGVLSTDVPVGLPDRVVCIRYLFGLTEFKAVATIVATGVEQQMTFSAE